MLQIIYKKTIDLIPYVNNTRTHDDKQVTQIASSMKEFGFTNPILIDETNEIIAGHGRLMAANKLKLEEVPTILLSGLSKAQKKAYVIADNKLALNAGWNEELLKVEFAQLKDLDFDLSLTGFDMQELKMLDDVIIEELEEVVDEDSVPEIKEIVSVLGDVWILGNHRLMCGDSTKIDDVEKLMNGVKADLLHTDPPYNVNYSNKDRPNASKKDLGYIKNDSMGNDEFYKFLYDFYVCAYTVLKDNSSVYIWHASSEHINFTQALLDSGFEYKQQIIWKKPMLLGRGKYQWAHEPCLFGIKGSPYFTEDRKKTTVWDFGGYDKSKNVHPTQKPIFIPEEAILNSTKINDIVLDLFGGSGSTMIACEKNTRVNFTMEFDPKFVDVIIKRWQEYTKKEAVLESTSETFNTLYNNKYGKKD